MSSTGAQIIRPLLSLCVALAIAITGCATPPDGAISDAEKALLDASFAEECAGETYRAARKMLEDARAASEAGNYDEARRKALAAQKLAEQARADAELSAEECEKRKAARAKLDEKLGDDAPPANFQPTAVEDDYLLQTVYFGFDKAVLTPEAQETLSKNASWLIQHPETRVLIEGHTDARGTVEYNLALSQQRARAVRRYLQTLGVGEGQLKVVALGEQRPASFGDSEDDHSQNRRAEFRVKE